MLIINLQTNCTVTNCLTNEVLFFLICAVYVFFVALFFSCEREKIEEGVVIKVADFQKELAMDSVVDDIYYYCMDSNHSITKSLFPYSENSMQGADSRGMGGRILSYDKQNNAITMVEPFSDRVFELKDNALQVKYTLKFEGNNIDHKQTELNVFELPETYIDGYLDLKDKKIVSFLNDSKFYYTIFSDNGESVVSGRIVDHQTKLPFYVRWQYGGRAVGTSDYTCLEEYLKSKGLENNNDTVHNNMFLLFYKLK